MKYIKLDTDEQKIVASYGQGKWKSDKNLKKRMASLRDSARATMNKTKNINIRLSEYAVYKLKAAAVRQGLPYQTLASSVLHRYAAGEVVKQ